MSRWINPNGYLVTKVGEDYKGDIQYLCSLHPTAPLSFEDNQGNIWQPNKSFITNFGSIPRLFWVLPWLQKDHYILSFLLHDSAYHFGGLYKVSSISDNQLLSSVSDEPESITPNSTFTEMERKQADDLLYDGIVAEGGWKHHAYVVWSTVRTFGKPYWKT